MGTGLIHLIKWSCLEKQESYFFFFFAAFFFLAAMDKSPPFALQSFSDGGSRFYIFLLSP